MSYLFLKQFNNQYIMTKDKKKSSPVGPSPAFKIVNSLD